ncbi:MAG: phospho-sugar mutase [Clostridium sp.]|uniref:phospho-sugar mutase n=1 Tax=Clostridium sp. TaxID=1506 RepID=UPI002FC9339D
MDIEILYKTWLGFNEDVFNELSGIADKEKEDRFYKEISFGTGGIRGEIGYGTNRVNIYTIGRACAGTAKYLLDNFNKPSVLIAYDSRIFSLEFARLSYMVFTSMGVSAKLFKAPAPTPLLSYGVRRLKATAGIVITASHNPKQYNGFKVYGSDGGQITKDVAGKIFNNITKSEYNCSIVRKIVNEEVEKEYDYVCDMVCEEYYESIMKLSFNTELVRKYSDSIKIVYTPLHGVGGAYIKELMKKIGYTNVFYVKSQFAPNGEFPTVKYPNPEEEKVFEYAKKLGEDKKVDLLIATDPDCDRVGIMVRNKVGEYVPLTGNEIGSLLTYYVLSQISSKSNLKKNSVVIKTIVTTDIAKEICDDFNVEIEEVLTGFKYIGEKIKEYESSDKNFILGFEESYGYLVGDFVRDKDGVIATILISEMALYYKSMGMSLLEILDKLHKKYGYYKEKLVSYEFPGIKGDRIISSIMDNVRSWEFLKRQGIKPINIIDYGIGIGNLPKENVVGIVMEDSKVIIRPSGTEPKIKFYLSSNSRDDLDSAYKIKLLENNINNIVETVNNIED